MNVRTLKSTLLDIIFITMIMMIVLDRIFRLDKLLVEK